MKHKEFIKEANALINLIKMKKIWSTMVHYGITRIRFEQEEEYNDQGSFIKFISRVDMDKEEAFNMLQMMNNEGLLKGRHTMDFIKSIDYINKAYEADNLLDILPELGERLLRHLKVFIPNKSYTLSECAAVDEELENRLHAFYEYNYGCEPGYE